MYSRLQVVRKYLRYLLHASNGKGHGIHSPFVYNFIRHVLNDTETYDEYEPVESLRSRLLKDDTVVEVEDMGAGSAILKLRKRKISEIAMSSVKSKNLGQLLFRMARYYQPRLIIELGTSLGITTSYLASGNPHAQVITLEGAQQLAFVANKNSEELSLSNVRLTVGNFNDTLPRILQNQAAVDMAFVDGNHSLEPTLNYFNMLMQHVNSSSILIFDDIHWSKEMEEAWENIRCDSRVRLSIDLFFMGLVFFRDELKVKQHYTIRF